MTFAAIEPQEGASITDAALIVIDVTNFDAHPDYGFAEMTARHGLDLSHYWDRVENTMLPNVLKLVEAWRSFGGRIAFARVGAQLEDYGDSLVHLRSNHREGRTLRGTPDFDMRVELQPRIGEIVVDKPGFGMFTTSNIDVLLRNAGVTSLVVVGVVSNACVLVSALGAFDLGYSVKVVEDATAGPDERLHESAMELMAWLGLEITSTEEVLAKVPVAAQAR
jgi:nicotinamidase-related amidase